MSRASELDRAGRALNEIGVESLKVSAALRAMVRTDPRLAVKPRWRAAFPESHRQPRDSQHENGGGKQPPGTLRHRIGPAKVTSNAQLQQSPAQIKK